MSKTRNAINRLRQQKLDREATAVFSRDSGEESEPILSTLRIKLRRKWASALARADLERISEESLHSIGQEILASSPLVDVPEAGISADVEIDSGTLWDTLADNQLFETASELRAVAMSSVPQEAFDLSALSPVLDTPLSVDKHLHKYVNAYPSSAEPLTVDDQHIHASGKWVSRARRWHVNWPNVGAVEAFDSTGQKVHSEKEVQLPDTLVPAV